MVDPHALAECVQDTAMGNLAGGRHMMGAKTLAPGPQYARPGSAVEAHQEEIARGHLKRAKSPTASWALPGLPRPMFRGIRPCGSRVPVPIVGAFAEMPSDVDALAEVIASALAAGHIQFFSTSAAEAKGVYKKRIQTA